MISFASAHLRSVLCFGAHADDIEIGCGGALLQMIAARPEITIHWVVLGANEERAQEARRSAEVFLQGAPNSKIFIHGFRDSYFPYCGAEIKECFEAIRQHVSPDLIFTHRREDLHQDHRIVAELTACAFRDAVILEYEIPKFDGDLGQANVYVPLDEDVCARKLELLMAAFPSQQGKDWYSEETFRATMRLRGIECRSASGWAEGFVARKMVLDWAGSADSC